jgi:hypothetical protein
MAPCSTFRRPESYEIRSLLNLPKDLTAGTMKMGFRQPNVRLLHPTERISVELSCLSWNWNFWAHELA